jgi:plasmid stability protein
MEETVKTSFILPESLYRDLRLRALEERRSATKIVREVLAGYLKTPARRPKKATP